MEQPDETAAETAEETQDTAETAVETTTPPWGDDFDPQKAWDTIQTQRAEEKKLKEQAQRAREFEEKWDDEQAHLEFLRERGYELDEEEEDPDLYETDEGEQDPNEARIAWLEQQEAERLYKADLAEALPEGVSYSDLSEPERLFIRNKTTEGGSNPAALKKAVEQWQQWHRDLEAGLLERRRESKKGPHVSKVGKQATDMPDYDSMTASERRKAMTERYLQGQQ